MKTYIELWKAKQTWLDFSTEERGTYIEQVGTAIETLLAKGIEIIWTLVDLRKYY